MKKKLTLIVFAVMMLFAFQGMALAAEPIDAIKANIKKSVEAVKAAVPSVTVQEFKKIMDDDKEFFEIVDVREPDEYAAGYIANAILAPRGKAEWMIPGKIKDPEVQIYVYCKAGSRGALVTKMLLDAGYKKVTNVAGGFKEWAKAGYAFYNMHGQVVVTKDGFDKKPE